MGIMDLRERKSSSEEEEAVENKKSCTDCKTTKTPLWRGGPAGPKSLCNACGIRFRKKRRAVSDPNRSMEKKREKSSSHENELTESMKMRLFFLGSEVLLQTSSASPSVIVKKQRCQRRRRKLGEEEQAAFSLMAMSCGAVFA